MTAYGRLRDAAERLGTREDTLRNRQALSTASRACKDAAVEFRAALARHPDRSSAAAQKLARDFQGLLRNAERIMSMSEDRERRYKAVDEGRGGSGAGAGVVSSGPGAAALDDEQRQSQQQRRQEEEAHHQQQQKLYQQRQQQLVSEALSTQRQLEENEATIADRDAAVRDISSQIGQVHEIFRDLAVLVSDQGAQVDDLESNLGQATQHVDRAGQQLQRAETRQRNSRNVWCFLFLLIAALLAVLLLVIAA